MNYGKEDQLTSNTSKYLEANATSKYKIKKLGKFDSYVDEAFSLVIHAKEGL